MMENNNETIDPIAHEKRKRLTLKICVGVVAVIIICLWGAALHGSFVSFAHNDQSASQFVDNMKKQWQEAQKTANASAMEKTKAKEQVRETLTNIIVAAASSTQRETTDTTTTSSTMQQ